MTCAYDQAAETFEECGGKSRCHCPPPFHTCSCGIFYTLREWIDLPWVGTTHDHDAGGVCIEMRNCSCKSTRSVEIDCAERENG